MRRTRRPGSSGRVAQRFPAPAELHAAREAALRSGETLVVDSSSVRYLFDYRLPDDALLLQYIQPFGTKEVVMADKKDGTYWIVSLALFQFCIVDLPDAYRDCPRVVIGRHTFASMALRPDTPVARP